MSPEQNPLSGVKVMVIDDSNTIRRSAEIFLLQAGCTVILAEDGFDALAKITDHQPDLVFVDIMMPRLDGYQTCALIKKSGKHHATPVIMLSSKDSLFDRARGRMVGIRDGKYAHTHLPDPALGPRKVDVPVMYNAERFRPRYDGKLGDPMLLVGLD